MSAISGYFFQLSEESKGEIKKEEENIAGKESVELSDSQIDQPFIEPTPNALLTTRAQTGGSALLSNWPTQLTGHTCPIARNNIPGWKESCMSIPSGCKYGGTKVKEKLVIIE